ncbi:hypothetical protein C1J02_11975 [Sulfitobacter sp. SK011]|nr:hypothetical protein C1J02_11975 [Sulfitobacter sp. SK011]
MQRWPRDTLPEHDYGILPALEAAHLGDLPISAISSAFLTWDYGQEVREINIRDFDCEIFNKRLREWQEAVG